jgi:hypothetical protein
MLSKAQREAYERDGFIVVPDVFSSAEIAELRAVTDEFARRAARVTANVRIPMEVARDSGMKSPTIPI